MKNLFYNYIKTIKLFWTTIVFITIIVFLFVSIKTYYKREAAKAQKFCENLIPQIEQYKQNNYCYPEQLDKSWFEKNDVPTLINIKDFYLRYENYYLLRYKNPAVWHDNIFGYYSELDEWLQYDGY